MHDLFRRIAAAVSRGFGTGWFLLAVLIIVFGSGWYYNFSEDWKFNASLAASIFALIMLIFLQRSQAHGSLATHLKLDELIRTQEGARNELAQSEEHAERDLNELRKSDELE